MARGAFNLRVVLKATGARKVKAKLTSVGRTVNRVGRAVGRVSQRLASVAQFAGVAGGLTTVGLAIGAIILPLRTATKEFIEFETAMLNVRKVTNFTREETALLADDILVLSSKIPIAGKELAGIATIAGQLGFGQRFGAESISVFTDIVGRFSTVADITSEKAAKSFARIANIMQLNIDTVPKFADQFERLGSVFNELSNQTTATAGEIVNISERIGGAGKTFGLTVSEISAISATLVDVGESAERGSTAINQILTAAFRRTDEFAQIIGVTKDELAGLLDTDPRQAFFRLIESLGDLDKFETAEALGKIGIEGQRATNVALKLREGMTILTRNFATADAAWEGSQMTLQQTAAALGLVSSAVERAGSGVKGSAGDFGLSSVEIAGFAATMAQAGLATEEQGKTIAKALDAMKDDTFGFAAAMGMTKDSVQDLIAADPVGAFSQLAGAIDKMDPDSARIAMARLGLVGERQIVTFQSLASNADELASNVTSAQKAFKEVSSVQQEFDIFADSTANKIQFIKNRMQALRIEIGEKLAPMAVAFFNALEPLQAFLLPKLAAGFMDLVDAVRPMSPLFSDVGGIIRDNIEGNRDFANSIDQINDKLNALEDADVDQLAATIQEDVKKALQTAALLAFVGIKVGVPVAISVLEKSVDDLREFLINIKPMVIPATIKLLGGTGKLAADLALALDPTESDVVAGALIAGGGATKEVFDRDEVTKKPLEPETTVERSNRERAEREAVEREAAAEIQARKDAGKKRSRDRKRAERAAEDRREKDERNAAIKAKVATVAGGFGLAGATKKALDERKERKKIERKKQRQEDRQFRGDARILAQRKDITFQEAKKEILADRKKAAREKKIADIKAGIAGSAPGRAGAAVTELPGAAVGGIGALGKKEAKVFGKAASAIFIADLETRITTAALGGGIGTAAAPGPGTAVGAAAGFLAPGVATIPIEASRETKGGKILKKALDDIFVSTLKGRFQGAATGAVVGTGVAPGLGTAAGAGLGFIAPGIFEPLTSSAIDIIDRASDGASEGAASLGASFNETMVNAGIGFSVLFAETFLPIQNSMLAFPGRVSESILGTQELISSSIAETGTTATTAIKDGLAGAAPIMAAALSSATESALVSKLQGLAVEIPAMKDLADSVDKVNGTLSDVKTSLDNLVAPLGSVTNALDTFKLPSLSGESISDKFNPF